MNHVVLKIIVAICVSICAGCTSAMGDTKPPAALAQQSTVDQILDALDRRGRDLRALRADVKMTEADPDLGGSMSRSGWFVLQNRPDGSARAHAVFDRKMIETRTISEKIEYLLDGGKLIDRNYSRMVQVTRVVLAPGEKMNLLKLGEGPFPLPIGQKREDVLAQFDVKKIDAAPDDPPGTVHLELIPKERTSLARKFKSIDTWVSLTEELPVRIKTLDFNGATERTTDLSNVKINPELTDADFTLPKIDDKWNLHEESFQDGR